MYPSKYFDLIWQFGNDDQDDLEECQGREEEASVKALIKTKQADATSPTSDSDKGLLPMWLLIKQELVLISEKGLPMLIKQEMLLIDLIFQIR